MAQYSPYGKKYMAGRRGLRPRPARHLSNRYQCGTYGTVNAVQL